MKYLATLPTIPSYLVQYVRTKCGTVTGLEGEYIDLSCMPLCQHLLRRSLVGFDSKETALHRWPEMASGVSVGIRLLEPKLKSTDPDIHFYMLGPSGASEIVSVLQSVFEMHLINEWTIRCSEYAKIMAVPSKSEFVKSFMEANGIEYEEKEFLTIYKRLDRILNKVSDNIAIKK